MAHETPEEQRIRLYKKNLDKYGSNLIKCLECGLSFVKVGGHVVQVHGYETAKDYRIAHGMDPKSGKDMTMPEHRKQLARTARETGTTKNVINGGIEYRFKKNGRSKEIAKEYWDFKHNN